MKEIRLLKCKLVKKGESFTVEYSRQEKDGSTTVISEEHKAAVHQDLRNAFLGLHIHFAILADYVKVKQVKDIENYDSELIEGFTVSALHKGGAEDEIYIILTGSKITASGRAVTINTPILKIEDESEKGYKYLDSLLERVEVVESEVRAYLGGKHAPETQQSLSFPEEEPKGKKGNKAQILPPVTPESVVKDIVDAANGKGKGGRKKVPQSQQHPSGEAE